MIQVFKPLIVEEAIKSVGDVLASGWIGLGPKTEQFESDFGDYIGVKNVVAVNSATSALHLAVVLSGIKDSDEVITTANTFVSTNHVILYERAKPVFCDIEKDTGNIDVSKIEGLITDKTKAIICVHFGGYPCDMDKLVDISKKHNLVLIEDCAHACGAEYKDRKVGSFGDYACFSFQAVKNLPVGDGGMLVCKEREMYEKAKKLRWLGINKDTYNRSNVGGEPVKYLWKYDVPYVGYKYHINDISSAIGIEQLKYLDRHNERRKLIADYYRNNLKDVDRVVLPVYKKDRKSSCHFYPILVENRDCLIDVLKKHDIHPGVHYFRNDLYGIYEKSNLPNTEWFTNRELTLPMHLHLSDGDVEYIVDVVKKGW